MKTLSAIKKDLEFNRSLSSLIEVLKNIAVQQYRMLEQRMKSFEQLQLVIAGFFRFIDFNQVRHVFVHPAEDRQAVIAVTSDSGLLGGLNMQVVGAALAELEQIPGQLIVIGERGKSYASEGRIPFVAFPGIRDEERYEQAAQLRDYVINKVLSGAYSQLRVVYPRPVSFTVQKIEVLTLLPFSAPQSQGQDLSGEIILESRLADTVEYLVYLWIGHKLFEVFGLSRLAEFAARYVHLEESLQKLKDMDNKLKLQYFRARHELIDRNMRELFSARLLYAA